MSSHPSLTAHPHIAIRASAGAGKTYALTSRFVQLLGDGERLDKVLASTFSRKAAGEIILRVLGRLASEARGDEDAAAKKTLLSSVLRSLHRLRIGTLDAFFMALVQSFGLELGFQPGWRILDEALDKALKHKAIVAALSGEGDSTRALGAHILTLQRGDARRRVVSTVTDYVEALLPVYLDAPESAWSFVPESMQGTPLRSLEEVLHAISAFPLDKPSMRNARDKDVGRARAGEWKELLEGGVSKCVFEDQATYSRIEIPSALAQDYRALHAIMRHQRGQELLAETRAIHVLLKTVAEHYTAHKRALDGYGFDDVARTLAKQLSGEGTLDAETLTDISFRLDSRIHHLLLDEFQDTSLFQWQVLEPIAREIVSHADHSRSFFCVGDVKQAIYGWRGGVSEIFDRVDQALPNIDRKPLDESRRSSGVVIDFVNRVFSNLAANPALADFGAGASAWQRGFTMHRTVHEALPGHVRLSSAPRYEEQQKSATLAFASEEIARLHAEAQHASIGVLTRSNKAVRRIIWELHKRGVPASEEGGNPLTDSPAVMLVLSLFRIADHPSDTIARFHVAESALGEAISYKAWSSKDQTMALAAKVRHMLAERGYGDTLRHYAGLLEPHCDARNGRRLTQLAELAGRYDLQAGHDATGLLRPSAFIDFVKETKMEEPLPSRVRVMTIHQAKGLEFDIAVVCDLEEGLGPKHAALIADKADPLSPPRRLFRAPSRSELGLFPELQEMTASAISASVKEKLSNLYVALTRPRHALHIVLEPENENARKVYGKVGNVVRTAVHDSVGTPAGALLYEAGDPQWFTRVQWPEPAAPKEKKTKIPISLAAPRHFVSRATPSRLEGGMRVDVKEFLRLERRPALERGALVHAWLSQIAWIEEGLPDREKMLALAKSVAPHVDAASEYESFLAMLRTPGMKAALSQERFSGAGTLRAYREMPFAVREGQVLMTGSFDRVIVRRSDDESALCIIDWKTDRVVSDAELQKRVAYYKPQLEAYRRAAVTVFGVPVTEVRCELCFLDLEGRVVAV
jgi:ATP-dependent helicase/nuclease subunit A